MPSVTGTVVVDKTGTAPSVSLEVDVYDDAVPLIIPLAFGNTDAAGNFSIPLPSSVATVSANLRVEILAAGRRSIPFNSDPTILGGPAFGTITVSAKDCTNWIASIGSAVTQGNLITPYIDNEAAWSKLGDLVRSSKESISICELLWYIPYAGPPPLGNPPQIVIIRFDPTPGPRAANAGDLFPEAVVSLQADLLPTASDAVSILINDWDPGKSLLGRLPAMVIEEVLHYNTEFNVAQYFANAGLKNVTVLPFEVFALPCHAKMMLVDEQQGVLIGSPLQQSYWDTQQHAIGEWRRGNNAGSVHYPIHDVSVWIQGPAVADLYNSAFNLFWKRATEPPTAATPAAVSPPQPQTGNADQIAAVQIVRTLGAGLFTDPGDPLSGETGVLEAYQRAISSAKRFVYLETQYFLSRSIFKTLIAALKANHKLEVIVVCNITPDLYAYASMQDRAIADLRKKAESIAAGQLAIFAVWTHEPTQPAQPTPEPGAVFPRIAPTYIHAKVAIVDDSWATIGSANLDGGSLDETDYVPPAIGWRENEVNCVLYNGVDNLPASNVIANFRRQLWGEHLGLNPTASGLQIAASGAAGFLATWKQIAANALTQLQSDPTVQMQGRVLELPSTMLWGSDPVVRSLLVLQASGLKTELDSGSLHLVNKVPTYDFQTGWSK